MSIYSSSFMAVRLKDVTNRNGVIYDAIRSINDDDLVNLHNNTYVEDYPDERIYNNYEYEFNEAMGSEQSPWEIAIRLEGTDYSTSDSYFAFDGSGNIRSFDDASSYIDYMDLADYIERNGGIGIKKDWLDEDDIRYVFAKNYGALEKLTEEEIDNIDIMDFILEDWDDIIANVIADRKE